ncbi:hypothetical protein [Longimicrobium terrae]|uniref:Uncharacterized protein n=1 Tax=Longimicrobium terrae TaxID=1639882 RepID=A0A841H0U0_9BACT|nr:hypothetical protein [Longimicrobium terrae]MBB4637110.1 hypothetical protein [Longimicrobium terrae]MBB6071630.1 hypothetical protein [Longimicrobium terrae]NNC29954.1 hypothetical protein [Longimicrobium terrae]
MMRIHLRTVLLALAAAVIASPALAQRRADLAPALLAAEAAPSAVTEPVAVQPGVMDPRLIAPAAVERRAGESRSPSTGTHVGVGALAGAALGLVATFAQPGCSETGSMCGLAAVVFVPAGAVVGGGIGWLVARLR